MLLAGWLVLWTAAANRYADHLKDLYHLTGQADELGVLMLSDDANNVKLAKEEGIAAFRVRDFVKDVLKDPELEEMLAYGGDADPEDLKATGGAEVFAPHISFADIQRGCKSGTLVQGTFQRSNENSKEGFVTVHGMDKRVFVKGVDMNRAIHRDIVAIRIFNQADWSNPSGIVEVDSGAQSLLASSGTARTQSGNIR